MEIVVPIDIDTQLIGNLGTILIASELVAG